MTVSHAFIDQPNCLPHYNLKYHYLAHEKQLKLL